MIRVVHPWPRVQILTFYPSQIPDPGSKRYRSRIQGSKRNRIPDLQHCKQCSTFILGPLWRNFKVKDMPLVFKHNIQTSSVADPDLGSCSFLTPGSGSGSWMEKNQYPDPGSGMNIPDLFSKSFETVFVFKILKCWSVWPWVLYPRTRMEKFESAIRYNNAFLSN
jgi:hypothetical protein